MRMLFGASAAMAEDDAAIASAIKEIRPSKLSMCPSLAMPPAPSRVVISHRSGRRPGACAVTVFDRTFASSSELGKTAVASSRRRPPTRSERIAARLILDRHPLPLRELLPVGRTADSGAVARGADAAERYVRLVGDGLVVDVQKPNIESISDRDRTTDIGREHARRQPVFALGERDRLVLGGKGRYRRHRPEHFLLK